MQTVQKQRKGMRHYDFSLHTRPGATSISYRYPMYLADQPDWGEFRRLITALQADHITLVADEGLPSSLVTTFHQQIQALGVPNLLLFLDASEQNKTLATVHAVLTRVRAQGGGTHASCFIALGGGVIGNIVGLASALMVRGVSLIHIPTTLLSGTDSILSVKQGVNAEVAPERLVKNLLGVFKAPECVFVYPSLWQSLPPDEIRSGNNELIKNVCIQPALYRDVWTLLRPDARYSLADYRHIFDWCFQVKHQVMAQDAHEQGTALLLELGHTFGHALETLTHLPHGLAIGLGLLVSLQISHTRGLLHTEEFQQIIELLQRNGAPTRLPSDLAITDILALVREDNKRGYLPEKAGYCIMVLLEHLGQPLLTNGLPLTYVSEAEFHSALTALQESTFPTVLQTQEKSHVSHQSR